MILDCVETECIFMSMSVFDVLSLRHSLRHSPYTVSNTDIDAKINSDTVSYTDSDSRLGLCV